MNRVKEINYYYFFSITFTCSESKDYCVLYFIVYREREFFELYITMEEGV